MMGNERENFPATSEEDGGVGTSSTMEDPTSSTVGLTKKLEKKAMSNMDLATGNVGLKTRRDLKGNVDIANVDGRNGEESVQSSFFFSSKEFV
jgi:hypothetical protein